MLEARFHRPLHLALAVAFITGCESATGPEGQEQFDADAALADHEALDILLSSEAMEVFRALGEGISFQGSSYDLAAPEAVLEALMNGAGDPLASPIISLFNRGKTFAYDPEMGRYAWDRDRDGAPENGIRFVLYEPGPDGRPDPSTEIGYADLVDEGDGSVEDIALRLLVVEGADTVLDYRTTLDHVEGAGEVTVEGYLQGENDRLDFQIGVAGAKKEDGGTLDIEFEMGIDSRDFSIVGSVRGMEGGDEDQGEIDLLVRHGDDSFRVEVSGSGGILDGAVTLNGTLFANISGDADEPIFTGASGDSLTWAEMLVLRRIVDSTEDVFDFWEDLMDPVDELVLLAIIF